MVTTPAAGAGARTGGELDLVYVRTGPLNAEPGITDVYPFCPDGLSPAGGGLASTGSDTRLGLHGSFPTDDTMLVSGADGGTHRRGCSMSPQ